LSQGPVLAIFTIVRRKNLAEVIKLVRRYNPNVFYTIEDVRFANATFGRLMTNRRPLAQRRPFRLRK